jgi:hypothetical protein
MPLQGEVHVGHRETPCQKVTEGMNLPKCRRLSAIPDVSGPTNCCAVIARA